MMPVRLDAMARRTILITLLLVGLVAGGIWLISRGAPSLSALTFGGESTAEPTEPVADLPSGTTPAVVEYVHDGDTLFLEDGRKVRLLGIDTPEIGEDAECWGEEATMLLRTLLPEGSAVQVLADQEPLDQYGRALLFVYAPDGTNVNLELVRRGSAEAVFYEPNDLFQTELKAAEREAQDAGRGQWGACGS
jgi:micrococcal nuclease